MGKFKEFLITEEMGLGDLGKRIDSFYNNRWLGNQINGAFVTRDVPNAAEQSPVHGTGLDSIRLPNELTIPSFERTGRITTLFLKKNPIYVRLSDGTEAHFTYDEYKRIQGTPELGKTMTIIFQRHPNDWSQNASKIDKVIVRD